MIETYIAKRETGQAQLVEGLYTFNSQKRLHWLQRLCLTILERLGCQKYQAEDEVNMVPIDLQKIAGTIAESKHALADVYRLKARYVVLGHRQICNLDMEALGPCVVNLPDNFGNRFRPSLITWGLNLIMIPWLDDGILVLPDLDQMPAIGTSW